MNPQAQVGRSEPGTLYVVATPIGNLQDMSPRGIQTLKDVDWIACEDTRHSGKLLRHFGIQTRTLSYHEHNEPQRGHQLLQRLLQGESGALISDAGTPLISDPGFHLVQLCRQQGLDVLAIPGPSAALAALSISGLPCSSFLFAGFLPRKEGEARKFLEALKTSPATLLFYVPPHRLDKNLQCCSEVLGPRPAFLVRELTKLHEESWWGSLDELVSRLDRSPRGEYTLVVHGATVAGSEAATPLDIAAYVHGLQKLRGESLKQALKTASHDLGIPRNRLYRLVIEDRDLRASPQIAEGDLE